MSSPPAWMWVVCPPWAATVALLTPSEDTPERPALPVTDEVQDRHGVDLEDMR